MLTSFEQLSPGVNLLSLEVVARVTQLSKIIIESVSFATPQRPRHYKLCNVPLNVINRDLQILGRGRERVRVLTVCF